MVGNTQWSPAEDQILRQYYPLLDAGEIGKRFLPGRSHSSITTRASRIGVRKHSRPMKPVFDRELVPPAETLGEVWTQLRRFQDVTSRLDTHMEEIGVHLPVNEPVILGFLADAHIGAWSGKYDEIEDRVKLIEDTDRCYIVSLGDTIDNYLPNKHSSGMFEHIVPPALQKLLVEFLFGRLKGKWLAMVGGCHDEWSHDVDDFDWTQFLAAKMNAPYLGFGGFLDLTVGDQPYRIGLRHKYRYNSSFNYTHTVKRMREQLGDFDIGAVAHHHRACIEQMAHQDHDRIYLRPGSFKGSDRYSRRIGYAETGNQIPCIILFNDERRMIPFLNLRDAVTVLNAL